MQKYRRRRPTISGSSSRSCAFSRSVCGCCRDGQWRSSIEQFDASLFPLGWVTTCRDGPIRERRFNCRGIVVLQPDWTREQPQTSKKANFQFCALRSQSRQRCSWLPKLDHLQTPRNMITHTSMREKSPHNGTQCTWHLAKQAAKSTSCYCGLLGTYGGHWGAV